MLVRLPEAAGEGYLHSWIEGSSMVTERDFLAAIREEPEDDTHRLVYADWLEENDRPRRAELIRVQIALTRTGNPATRSALEHRQADLLADPAELLACGPLTHLSLTLTRGFVTSIFGNQPERVWGGRADTLNVFLAAAPALASELVHATLCFRFEDVGVGGMFCDGSPGNMPCGMLAELLRDPVLRHCAVLQLTHGQFSEEAAALLRDSPVCDRLVGLSLTGCEFASGSLAILLSAPWLKNLRSLSLDAGCFTINGPYDGYQNRPWTAEEIALLADCPNLTGLEELDLIGRCVTAEGAETILASSRRRELRRLLLSPSSFLPEGIARLRARFGERAVL